MTSFEYSIKNIYLGEEGGSPGRLPAEYQEVEWIQNDGSSYIRTNYDVGTGHIYKSKLSYSSATYWKTFGGHYGSSSDNRLFCGICEDHSNSHRGIGYGSSYDYSYGTPSSNTIYELDIKLAKDSQYLKINGTTKFTKSFSYTASGTHDVCVWGNTQPGNSVTVWGTTKIYYWKLYDASGNAELDLIPCYRKSDNVIGMYDLVHNVFYTNSGSGTFTKGPDV